MLAAPLRGEQSSRWSSIPAAMIIAEIIIASTRSTSGLGGDFGRGSASASSSSSAAGGTSGTAAPIPRGTPPAVPPAEPVPPFFAASSCAFFVSTKRAATADEEFGEADAGLAAGSGVGLRKWYYTSDLLIKQATGWLINDLRTFGYKPMRR